MSCEEAPFEELCDDSLVVSASPSNEYINPCTKPLGLALFHPPYFPPAPQLHSFSEFLGDIRGYNPSFNPYCAYLEDVPGNITWSTFCDHASNFSTAFGKCKRMLTTFASFFFVFSYLHHFEIHAKAHRKFLRALTAIRVKARRLREKEWLMLLKPMWHSFGTFSTRPGILVLTLLPSFYFLSFPFCFVVDIRMSLVMDMTFCFCW